uniref:Uncharacterized protein n=1 Tax=Oryza meridionalis TaxID=40149 RepID=A0A0E0DC45_9ORYZ
MPPSWIGFLLCGIGHFASRGTTELKGLMSIILIVLSVVALEKFQSLSCGNMWENRRSIANE